MAEKNDAVEIAIPIVQERAHLEKRVVPTERITVRTKVTESVERVEADLTHEDVEVLRVTKNVLINAVPAVREENGVMIYPVVEEKLVVERRLFLREEIHIVRRARTEHVVQEVSVLHSEPVVERTPLVPEPTK